MREIKIDSETHRTYSCTCWNQQQVGVRMQGQHAAKLLFLIRCTYVLRLAAGVAGAGFAAQSGRQAGARRSFIADPSARAARLRDRSTRSQSGEGKGVWDGLSAASYTLTSNQSTKVQSSWPDPGLPRRKSKRQDRKTMYKLHHNGVSTRLAFDKVRPSRRGRKGLDFGDCRI